MSTCTMNATQRFKCFIGAEACGIAHQHVGKPNNSVQRGAQLVAHIGEELRFMMVCTFELPAFFLDLAEQPGVLDGDDSLSGEVCQQLDVLVSERPNLLTVNRNGAY